VNYYIHEHRTAEGHQATVHVGPCECCKNGKDILGVSSAENGKWHGPFRSLSAAKSVVPRVNAEVHVCVQLRADPMQLAEVYAGQRIEPEADEAPRATKRLRHCCAPLRARILPGTFEGHRRASHNPIDPRNLSC